MAHKVIFVVVCPKARAMIPHYVSYRWRRLCQFDAKLKYFDLFAGPLDRIKLQIHFIPQT